MAMKTAAVIDELIRRLNENRKKSRFRDMSDRKERRLRGTARWLLDQARVCGRTGVISPEVERRVTAEAQSYFRDDWYDLAQQLEYLQLVRSLAEPANSRTRARRIAFFDRVVLLASEACGRPERSGWTLLVVVGFGDLVATHLTGPIRNMLRLLPVDCWIVDKRATARERARREFRKHPNFVRVLSPTEALEELAGEAGAFFTRRIVYVAVDTPNHLPVAKAYAAAKPTVVAIEKPLCAQSQDIAGFQRLARRFPKTAFVVVDHYGFRRGALLIEHAKRHPEDVMNSILNNARRITFRMLEKKGVDRRRGMATEGVILDMLPHLFPFVHAVLTGNTGRLKVKSVRTWRYRGSRSRVETAARVELATDRGEILAYVGKGVGVNRKEVRLDTETGTTATINLTTGRITVSDRAAPLQLAVPDRELGYGFVLHSLVYAPTLEFQNLDRAIAVVRLLLRLRSRGARNRRAYDLKRNPDWE
jgi:predicted dehydrogenase